MNFWPFAKKNADGDAAVKTAAPAANPIKNMFNHSNLPPGNGTGKGAVIQGGAPATPIETNSAPAPVNNNPTIETNSTPAPPVPDASSEEEDYKPKAYRVQPSANPNSGSGNNPNSMAESAIPHVPQPKPRKREDAPLPEDMNNLFPEHAIADETDDTLANPVALDNLIKSVDDMMYNNNPEPSPEAQTLDDVFMAPDEEDVTLEETPVSEVPVPETSTPEEAPGNPADLNTFMADNSLSFVSTGDKPEAYSPESSPVSETEDESQYPGSPGYVTPSAPVENIVPEASDFGDFVGDFVPQADVSLEIETASEVDVPEVAYAPPPVETPEPEAAYQPSLQPEPQPEPEAAYAPPSVETFDEGDSFDSDSLLAELKASAPAPKPVPQPEPEVAYAPPPVETPEPEAAYAPPPVETPEPEVAYAPPPVETPEPEAAYQPEAYEPEAYEPEAYEPEAYEPEPYQTEPYEPEAYQLEAYQPEAVLMTGETQSPVFYEHTPEAESETDLAPPPSDEEEVEAPDYPETFDEEFSDEDFLEDEEVFEDEEIAEPYDNSYSDYNVIEGQPSYVLTPGGFAEPLQVGEPEPEFSEAPKQPTARKKPPVKPAPKSVQDFEARVILEESRFVKNSIDHLVNRYFSEPDEQQYG